MKISKKTLYRIPVLIFLIIFVIDFVIAVCDQAAPEYWRVNVWVGNTLKVTWADTSEDNLETATYDIGTDPVPNATLCDSEGNVVAQFRARVQTVEACNNNLDFDSANSTTAYNINWDGDRADCECYGKTWINASSQCCGDDTDTTTDEDCYQDVGLRYYDGSSVVKLAVERLQSSALRIAKNGVIYNVSLVATTHATASTIRIQTSAGVKAIRKYTG